MRTSSRRFLRGIVITAAVAALMVPSAALAKGPGGNGTPGRGGGIGGGQGNGGGGGGHGEETTSNNLSVPTVFVGSNPFTVDCGGFTGDPVAPTPAQTPLSGYEVAGNYYVQGVHTWQANCLAADSASAEADWGDNLTGDAMLKVGSPIRVEVGLTASAAVADGVSVDITDTGVGYHVIKLEPSKLDRESAYGTLATQSEGVWSANPVTFPYSYTDSEGNPVTDGVRVYDAGAHLKIYKTDSPDTLIYDGPATAEINATGKVVYGYNLRVSTAGEYTIEFSTSNAVTLTNEGSNGHLFSLTILVGTGGGGGGGHRP